MGGNQSFTTTGPRSQAVDSQVHALLDGRVSRSCRIAYNLEPGPVVIAMSDQGERRTMHPVHQENHKLAVARDGTVMRTRGIRARDARPGAQIKGPQDAQAGTAQVIGN
jgi:hypothetical protein